MIAVLVPHPDDPTRTYPLVTFTPFFRHRSQRKAEGVAAYLPHVRSTSHRERGEVIRYDCPVHGGDCYSCVYEVEYDDGAPPVGYCDPCEKDREPTPAGTCDVCGHDLWFESDPREDPKYWSD